ncbi:EmrB/QacA subfamily drug resistance transporter [Deinobacterium chartae]|uniref:EmrB/QacA subfamily drug resistance transporter n=1 Tax=Deinobacterium chartae TaxID=521158 RepID=A0A841HZJ7_9DEIO|nr:MDR family MFS transporter [Deinobacterium chartae]MBB6098094.1 EmrB/QacA subfamily drug resistance transporter [Deinobacterium chartae]
MTEPFQAINYARVLDHRTKMVVLFGVLMCMLLAALDQTIVATALPRIASELNGLNLYSWVTTAYLLASTALVPIYGKLSDLYGRKPVLVFGVVVFLIASALCGAAGEPFLGDLFGGGMMQLVVFRALQGVGGAAITGIAFSIVADLFEGPDRAKYQGLFGAVFGLASVVGPLLGGFLTDTVSWRWVFYVNLPLGLVALAFLLLKMPRLASGLRASIDYLGAVLIVVFSIPLLLAMTWGSEGTHAWSSSLILGLFALSAVALLTFLWVQTRVPSPILPLSLFKNLTYTWVTITRFLLGAFFLGAIVYLSLFAVNVLGVSATSAGTVTLPLTLGLILSAQLSGMLAARIGKYKPLVLGGMILATLGFVWLSTISVNTSYWALVPPMLVLGLGIGPSMSLLNLAVQNAVPRHEIGVATSSGQFFQQMGSTIGVALFGAVLTASLTDQMQSNLGRVQQQLPPEIRAQITALGQAQGGEGSMRSSFDADAVKQQVEQSIHRSFEQQRQARPESAAALEAAEQRAVSEARGAVDQVGSAIKQSFAYSIARIYFWGIFVALLALAAVLCLPNGGLEERRAAPPAAGH